MYNKITWREALVALYLFICITFLCFGSTIYIVCASEKANKHHVESYYQEKIAEKENAKREVVLDDGARIDIVTDTYVGEVDFAHKFYEAIGQSAYYSFKTGKKPVIWLIKESEKDDKYIERCKILCKDTIRVKVSGEFVPIEVRIFNNMDK